MALGLIFATTGAFRLGSFGFVVIGAVIAVVVILFVILVLRLEGRSREAAARRHAARG